MTDAWEHQKEALGGFIRAQRKLASLSLRQLSDMADISNAYLSQIERGLHEPSIRVLKSVATALGIAPGTLLEHAGLIEDEDDGSERSSSTEDAIKADPNLTDAEKAALLSVYRSYRADHT
ncbi:MAG: helix-turn-helix domain-containing protein [Acidimicrobiia bacterium]|nr:helix-turn-helix domain-containing protein [Acidimicrobiia bacterium]NNL28178.1 helix-turn-helix domain-containing protein [Acidimicrobiia bacterium]